MSKYHKVYVKAANDVFGNTFSSDELALFNTYRDNVILTQNGYVSNSYTVSYDDSNTMRQTWVIDNDTNAYAFAKNINDNTNPNVSAMRAMLAAKVAEGQHNVVTVTHFVELSNGAVIKLTGNNTSN